jgi:hypothetical protein
VSIGIDRSPPATQQDGQYPVPCAGIQLVAGIIGGGGAGHVQFHQLVEVGVEFAVVLERIAAYQQLGFVDVLRARQGHEFCVHHGGLLHGLDDLGVERFFLPARQ